jgi:hypothetical protein
MTFKEYKGWIPGVMLFLLCLVSIVTVVWYLHSNEQMWSPSRVIYVDIDIAVLKEMTEAEHEEWKQGMEEWEQSGYKDEKYPDVVRRVGQRLDARISRELDQKSYDELK